VKIAGTVTGKTNQGDVIELDEVSKAAEAIKMAVHWHEGFAGKSVTLEKLVIKNHRSSGRGDPLNKLYQNRDYEASGEALVWLRDQASDAVRHPKLHSFTVKFHDTLDEYGLPDLQVDELTVD